MEDLDIAEAKRDMRQRVRPDMMPAKRTRKLETTPPQANTMKCHGRGRRWTAYAYELKVKQ